MVTVSDICEVLAAHPGVRRADGATLRHDGRVVTVVAVESNEFLSGPVLRDHVCDRLGEGPAGVLIVDRLPMTGGLIDVGELTAAVADGRCTLFEDPRDDLEARLAAIWAEQMDVKTVGVNDDFLELGGDSLSALGIIAAIETEFDRSLDVYEFMSTPSVARLAETLR